MKTVDGKMNAGIETLDSDDKDLLDFYPDDCWGDGHDESHPEFQISADGCYIGHEASMIGFNHGFNFD